MKTKIPLTTSTAKADDDTLLFPAVGAAAAAHGTADEGWFMPSDEGELAVDVLEGERDILVRSAIAGVRPEDLEVFVNNDMLTIRGQREERHEETAGRYLVRECHWGAFSRSIILPTEVDTNKISATLTNGVLTVRLPKIDRSKKIVVKKI